MMVTSRGASRTASPAASDSSFTSSIGGPNSSSSKPSAAFPLLPRRSSVGKSATSKGTTLSLSSSSGLDFGWIDFASQGNPTIQLRLTRSWSMSLTYAEIVQYLCIFLSLRHFISLRETTTTSSLSSSPSPASFSTSSYGSLTTSLSSHLSKAAAENHRAQQNIANIPIGDDEDHQSIPSPPLLLLPIHLNLLLFLLSTTTLGIRRRAEHLGLRQTSLLLCLILLFLTIILGGGHHETIHNFITGGVTTTTKSRRDHRVPSSQSQQMHRQDDASRHRTCQSVRYGDTIYQPLSNSASPDCRPQKEGAIQGEEEIGQAVQTTEKAIFGDDGGEASPIIDNLCLLLRSQEEGPHRARLSHRDSKHSVVIECG